MNRKAILVLILVLATAAVVWVRSSGAYLSDSAQSGGNSFTAGSWQAQTEPDTEQ